MVCSAQLKCPPLGKINNDGRFNITAGIGPTLLYRDINYGRNVGFAGVLKGDYKIYKGLFAGIEGQFGMLNSYGKNYDVEESNLSATAERDARYVKNYYLAGTLNVTVYPGLFFVDEARDFRVPSIPTLIARGLYAGIGFGGIINQYDKLYRGYGVDSPSGRGEAEEVTDEAGNTTRKYKTPTRDLLWPVFNVGLSMPINKYSTVGKGYWSAVLNSQFNFAAGDQLDAYTVGSKGDVYNLTYLGLKYTF
ncbi:hypothetical protein ACFSR5_05115 [Sphingobacterium suaedae]|uniref:Outer membrane protein beta-barrel domain-containing protein n=1 Tax=Sphingobacterium suaedae TaxID=1686402 RepID=A0ABW5KGA2_9SPHI